MKIRPVLESEIGLLRDISIKTFVDAFGDQNTQSDMDLYISASRNIEQVTKEFHDPNVTHVFLEEFDQVVGFMKINSGDAQTETLEQQSIELERIYLLDGHQGKGYGGFMIEHFEALGKRLRVEVIWLGVWKKNPRAVEFYQRHGFEIFAEHDYLLGTDLQRDYLMKKSL